MVRSQVQLLMEGIQYRGREGQWSWILHRVTGLGIFLFLVLHIFDIYLMGFGPQGPFNSLLFIYHQPWARIMHIFLFFGVLFHAINGIRITIFDFWPRLWRYQRSAVWLQVVVFLAIFVPSTVSILVSIASGH
ncbi:MAG TPA: succinate dehydrogenase, cytochrome b556 subunit [Ardenticatenaceae bacterium]|nr:succinate dehydrogenase, cytochrome b556 subunit [Ardenticatenaceae bacterium]